MVLRKAYGNKNEQSRSKNEQAGVYRSADFRHKQDSYVWHTKPKYEDRIKLFWTDTDSFIVLVNL